jgi:hypothetical protein
VPLVKRPIKTRDCPLITVRFPPAHAKALRLRALATGEPLQALVCDLVAQWYAVNVPVHETHKGPTRASVQTVPIPNKQETRENTGRNEPFRTLSKIDSMRKNAPRGATSRD